MCLESELRSENTNFVLSKINWNIHMNYETVSCSYFEIMDINGHCKLQDTLKVNIRY